MISSNVVFHCVFTKKQATDKTIVNSVSWVGYPYTWSPKCPVPSPSGNKTYAQNQFCGLGDVLYAADGKNLGLSGTTCGGDSGGPILVTVQPDYTAQYPTATSDDALAMGWADCGWNSTTQTVVSEGCNTGGMVGTLIGVVSYGPSTCGTAPGVYTRVSSYASWMQNEIRIRGSVIVPVRVTAKNATAFMTALPKLGNVVRTLNNFAWVSVTPYVNQGAKKDTCVAKTTMSCTCFPIDARCRTPCYGRTGHRGVQRQHIRDERITGFRFCKCRR